MQELLPWDKNSNIQKQDDIKFGSFGMLHFVLHVIT
jgi:hypothetical protein